MKGTTTMSSKGIKDGIKGAQSDLAALRKQRAKHTGRELKDVDAQIKTLEETIKLYQGML